MSLIIDGHNLVPNIPGLHLSDLDDEQRLIEMVQKYCRNRRKKAEIYFDNAPPGLSLPRKFGMVKVKFSRKGRSADQEIKERLLALGREARNWVVVTSDHSIQLAARAARAQVIPSDEFSSDLLETLRNPQGSKLIEHDPVLSDEDVAEWMRIFQQNKKK